MKTNKIIIIAIVILLLAAVAFHIKNKKGKTFMDEYFPFLGNKKKSVATPPIRSEPEDSDVTFFHSLGYGDMYLDMMSAADKKMARHYIENYTRKGLSVTKGSDLYNNLVRINSYTNMFPMGIKAV